ncbi:MAG: ATP-binding cassette domain-containing protein [Bacteroidia bacterium]
MNSITLKNVMPVPLADTPLHAGSCWKNQLIIDLEKYWLVEAPSGTGKSTLTGIIYGTRNDYTGDVLLNEENYRSLSPGKWSDLRTSFFSCVFQDMRLFPALSTLENIVLKNNMTETFGLEQIKHMCMELGLEKQLYQPCGTLSLGQQQRVAIIRALVQPFKFLLLDEPFSHLDEKNSQKAAEMIIRRCDENQAGLLLTSLGNQAYFPFNGNITI